MIYGRQEELDEDDSLHAEEASLQHPERFREPRATHPEIGERDEGCDEDADEDKSNEEEDEEEEDKEEGEQHDEEHEDGDETQALKGSFAAKSKDDKALRSIEAKVAIAPADPSSDKGNSRNNSKHNSKDSKDNSKDSFSSKDSNKHSSSRDGPRQWKAGTPRWRKLKLSAARRQRCHDALRLVPGCSPRSALLLAAALLLPTLLGLAVGRNHNQPRRGPHDSGQPNRPSKGPTTAGANEPAGGGAAGAFLSPAPNDNHGVEKDPNPVLDLGSGLTLRTVVKGDGQTFVKAGDYIYVHYVGTLAGTDVVFDETRSKEKLLGFPAGRGRMIKGWEAALPQMSLGQRAILHVPSELGYGAKAHGKVPANADLDFDIELLVVDSHAKGLSVQEIEGGDGVTYPRARDRVLINFRAYLPSGQKFADTWDQGRPFGFSARIGQVMLGWDLAILQMSLGERALIHVPAYLAFGSQGNGQVPPNADLRFDMRLEKVVPYGDGCMIDNCAPPPPAGPAPAPHPVPSAPPALSIEALPNATPSPAPAVATTPAAGGPQSPEIPRKVGDVIDFGGGLTLTEVQPGDGVTYPKAGDWVEIHYIGTLSTGGSPFDSSRDRGKPIRFRTGVGRVIRGWELVVPRMSVGERGVLRIPSRLAYGSRARPKIPANSDLVFDLELLAVQAGSPRAQPAQRPISTTAAPSVSSPSKGVDCRYTAC